MLKKNPEYDWWDTPSPVSSGEDGPPLRGWPLKHLHIVPDSYVCFLILGEITPYTMVTRSRLLSRYVACVYDGTECYSFTFGPAVERLLRQGTTHWVTITRVGDGPASKYNLVLGRGVTLHDIQGCQEQLSKTPRKFDWPKTVELEKLVT